MGSELLRRVVKCIERFGMLAPGDRVVVGCSGGADSTCLLDVLARGLPHFALSLVAVYVDHGLRQETRAEAEAVAGLARACGAEYVYARVDVPGRVRETGESVQEAARLLRYRELEQVADETGAARIAVGHTRTDQAETVLLQLIRGTGPKGLAGIAPVHGRVIRPLLEVSREETRAYCLSRGLTFVDDPSNATGAYLRNRVRLELMPLLARYNPGVEEHLARLADIVREEEALLDALVDQAAARLLKPVEGGFCSGVQVDGALLLSEPRAIGRRLIRRAHARVRGDERGLSFEHVEKILEGAARRAGTSVIGCFGGVEVRSEYGRLLFLKPGGEPGGGSGLDTTSGTPRHREGEGRAHAAQAGENAWEQELRVPGETRVEALGITVRTWFESEEDPGQGPRAAEGGNPEAREVSARLDWERLKRPLVVRSRRPGDRLQPAGLSGTKKVKDILIDAKVPRRLRESVPIIADGDGVVWVVGHTLAQRARPSPESAKIMRIAVEWE